MYTQLWYQSAEYATVVNFVSEVVLFKVVIYFTVFLTSYKT